MDAAVTAPLPSIDLPSLNPGDKIHIWTAQPNGYEVHTREVTVFSVGVAGGKDHITASDFCVYTRYPMMNLVYGTMDELWLRQTAPSKDNEYPSRLDGWEVERNSRKPHPRMLQLFKEKLLPTHEQRRTHPTKLEAYTHPGTTISIVKDNGGHLWCGDLSRSSVKMFTIKREPGKDAPFRHPEPQIMFAQPHLSYLGPDDGEEIWWTEYWRGSRADDVKHRLTICTYEVRKVIEESGMWGHYHPVGEARTDPEKAKEGIEAVKGRAWDYDKLKGRITELEGEVRDSETRASEVGEKSREHQQTAAELKTVNDDLQAANADLTREVEAFRARANRPRGFNPLWKEEAPKESG